MKDRETLHRMCQDVLSQVDIKAICKHRGLPTQAASSRVALESFLRSDAGVAAAFGTLHRDEIILLHLLAAIDASVDVTFFCRVYPPKNVQAYYATFSQRYQSVFAKVKERFVRRGILVLSIRPEGWQKKTKLERCEFTFPSQFASHLPPAIDSSKQLDGEGDECSAIARDKVKTVTRRGDPVQTGDKIEIVDRELRLGGQPFRAARLIQWQIACWKKETASAKSGKHKIPFALSPAEAAVQVLGSLGASLWSDTEGLATTLKTFCGAPVDAEAICESGWRWGRLTRQIVDGEKWYRLVPQTSDPDIPPHEYLDVRSDGNVTVDLETVPFEALERLVSISDQQPSEANRPVLLLTPNLVKLGRAAESVLSLPLVGWLQENVPAFGQAAKTLRKRRGKTIVHENLSIARVDDLSLKVAIEKTLGGRIVSLSEKYIAFPKDAIGDVKRVVTKSGHVVREASSYEH